MYGTTISGGYQGGGCDGGCGVVFELTPSGGGWMENTLYSFSGSPSDGSAPENGLIFDDAGNLYSTTLEGGINDLGTVFQLTPSGSGWAENILYKFQCGNDGLYSWAGLIFDPSGNLYGAASEVCGGGGGTVFELTPSGGSWTYSLVYSFTRDANCTPGGGPEGTLVMDGAGNLYGTTVCGGANDLGTVFKLTPSGGSWTYTSLHDFTGGSDGRNPYCKVVFDTSGNLYGTASGGGSQNAGVVWEIRP